MIGCPFFCIRQLAPAALENMIVSNRNGRGLEFAAGARFFRKSGSHPVFAARPAASRKDMRFQSRAPGRR
jgi:hypothetical protein